MLTKDAAEPVYEKSEQVFEAEKVDANLDKLAVSQGASRQRPGKNRRRAKILSADPESHPSR